MSAQQRIKSALQRLSLPLEEVAAILRIDEPSLLAAIEGAEASFAHQLEQVFGISASYIEMGKGPIFAWTTLPVKEIIEFRNERNWQQFHTPKDLAISLSLEAAELLECFQWSASDLQVSEHRQQMEEELADILIYAVHFADAIGSDIASIVKEKLKKNQAKYGVKQSWGNARKYTEFEGE